MGEENQSGGCFVSQCFYARHHQYYSFTPQIYGPYNFGAPFAGIQRTRVEDLNFSLKIMNCIQRIFPRIDIVGVDISFCTQLQGDSGGPAVCLEGDTLVQVGVTSFVADEFCDVSFTPGFPSIETGLHCIVASSEF